MRDKACMRWSVEACFRETSQLDPELQTMSLNTLSNTTCPLVITRVGTRMSPAGRIYEETHRVFQGRFTLDLPILRHIPRTKSSLRPAHPNMSSFTRPAYNITAKITDPVEVPLSDAEDAGVEDPVVGQQRNDTVISVIVVLTGVVLGVGPLHALTAMTLGNLARSFPHNHQPLDHRDEISRYVAYRSLC